MKRPTPKMRNGEREGLQEKVAVILKRLEHDWKSPEWEPSRKPVDELVATILSQNTSDTNTERAFSALRERYPDWRMVPDSPVEDLVSTIRAGGLAQQKAPRIQRVLSTVLDPDAQDPNESLQTRLTRLPAEDAMNHLTALPGVGPKTAACVLLFAVGMPVVPVDTHVFRVSRRIGLIGPDTNANDAHDELAGIVAPDDAYRFHVQFIRHGRTICRARKPACTDCSLIAHCDYGSTVQSET